MSLAAGTKLGPYEVLAPIGVGGMGEVYRAQDTRLDRTVAVKILPEGFARDPNRLARFEHEAKALAALSHPNILSVHDFGVHQGTAYAVTELLEGETLRDRLAGGALPQRKAVEYASQIASGLAAAHDKGIVHRDLKPANLFVTTDGRVKILDFGLAAHLEAPAGEQSNLETEARHTDPGTVLGTAGYMSPEQAAGQRADARSDLFSLGCVLYEMLSGKRAFVRDTVPETLTAILREDPPSLADLSPPLPGPLERLVLHCLEKRPEDRFQSARDLAFDLQALSGSAISGVGERAPGRVVTPRLRWLWPTVTAAALAVAATSLLWRGSVTQVAARQATFVDITLPPGVRLWEGNPLVRLSNDGRRLVFLGVDTQGGRLWLRDLDSAAARPLPGTESSWPAAWSRDSRGLAFVSADWVLKLLDVPTGAVKTLAPMPRGGGVGSPLMTWNQAGDAVVSAWCLLRLAASGGTPTVIALPDASRGEVTFDAPHFLPDGRHYLFSVLGLTSEQSGVYVAALGSAERRLVLPSVSWAAFAPQGYLLFRRGSTLFAQRFDPSRLELSGQPDRLLEGVFVSLWSQETTSVGGDTLAFVSGATRRFRFTWFDRRGRESGRVAELAEVVTFDLSPDGTRVVASIGFPGNLWLIDTSRGSSTLLTQGKEDDDPRFSGDGQSVLFGSGLPGRRALYRMSLSGGSQVPVLREPPTPPGSLPGRMTVHDWSRDGRVALYTPDLENTIWSVRVSGEGEPQPVVRSTAFVNEARFSPDARWIAYNGNETGRHEVFVVPFPVTGERWQVSTAGGVQPLWRGDGRELFYLDLQGNLVSVEVKSARTFAAGPPRMLFRTGIENPNSDVEDYGVTADGQRFLLKLPAADTRPPELKLVLDWPALLGKQSQTMGGSPP